MKLTVTDARAWYLWMLAGMLTGIALAANVHAAPQHKSDSGQFPYCYTDICFS